MVNLPCRAFIVSSTSITVSASCVHQHTLDVKLTGRVEKRAGFGKFRCHHRDRDGRITLGRSTLDIFICAVWSSQMASVWAGFATPGRTHDRHREQRTENSRGLLLLLVASRCNTDTENKELEPHAHAPCCALCPGGDTERRAGHWQHTPAM